MLLQAKDGTVDPYVVLQLDDPASVKPEVQASSSMTNEPNPHYNAKFDFAMISATSTLRIHVYDKKTTMQNVLAHPVKMLTGNITGEDLGRIHCPLCGSLGHTGRRGCTLCGKFGVNPAVAVEEGGGR